MSDLRIISSAAHFLFCTDTYGNPHGHIVLSDGQTSPAILSKKMARDIVRSLHETETLSADEEPELKRQIDASPLSEEMPFGGALFELSAAIDDLQETVEAHECQINVDASDVMMSLFHRERDDSMN